MNTKKAASAYGRDGIQGLERVLELHPPEEEWLDELVDSSSSSVMEESTAATWLVRAYLMAGAELTKDQTARLIRSLARVPAGDARLHVCQTVRDLRVPARNAEQLARFLRDCANGDHKFTRAWAVDGFQALAAQNTKYAREAGLVLERAERDPAASVRARVRRIRKGK